MKHEGFEKGQYVVYSTNGICLLEDVREMRFITGEEKSTYYILNPISANASTIFVTADNAKLVAKMRALMTKEEIDTLLTGMRDKEFAWENDRRCRAESFHEILLQGVTEELLLMIRCIYMKKCREIYQNIAECAGNGRRIEYGSDCR